MVSNDRSAPSRRGSWSLALAALAVAVAPAVTSCSDPTSPTPQVMMNSTIGPGSHSTADCGVAPGTWVAIGTNASLVQDGSSYEPLHGTASLPVSVQCSVAPTSSSGVFKVTASATLSGNGQYSGSVTIVGSFTPTGTQSNVEATFQKGNGEGSFTERDCTVTYTAGTNQGVKAGAVWGMLECPTIIDSNQSKTCEGTAEFRFENCGQ